MLAAVFCLKNNMKKFIRKTLYFISSFNFVYKIAKRIVFDYRGENNCEIETNGEMMVLKDKLKNSDVIFDVGANVGDWTKTALELTPQALIHSFEPCKETFLTLKNNSFPENVFLNNFGLGSRDEEKEFFVSGTNSTVNSLFKRDALESKTAQLSEKISLKSLDNYCLEKGINKINFLKIDVEGNEYEVLLGAKKMLETSSIDYIQLEYGGTYISAKIFLKDVFEFFKDFDYSFYKIKYNKVERVEYSEELENFQYCNYLIVKNGL